MNTNQFTATLSLRVTQITPLTPHIYRYQLRANSGAELPLINAGAQLAIPVTLSDGTQSLQRYAICSTPNQREFYEIAVRHEPNNHRGSQAIVNTFAEGALLECDMPSYHFHLHADASPAILIASGIGIAAIIPLAHTLQLRGRRFQLHYAGRSKIKMAFLDELQKSFTQKITLYAADENEHVDIIKVLAEAPANSVFYACGSQQLLAEITTSARLLGINSDQIQTAYFAPETTPSDKAVVLELARSNKLINARADQSLLTALRNAGVNVNFDCGVGDCGTCAVKILKGEAEHRDHVLSDAQKAQGFMCVCVSRAKSDALVLEL